MFERLNTPQEVLKRDLGSALTMEREIVEMLDELIGEAHDEVIRGVLRAHQSETWGHVQNVEEVFGKFGWELEDSPCPTISAIAKEGKGRIKKAGDAVIDSVILAGAMETEHHEIAVYESLILQAQAFGREDGAEILAHNLAEEQQALERLTTLARELSRAAVRQPA